MPSSPFYRSVTSSSYQPFALALVVGPRSVMVGLVLSTLMLAESPAAAVSPASSAHVSDAPFSAALSPEVVFDCTRSPLPLSGYAARQALSRPDSESSALKRFVTSWLYQPFPFGLVVGPRSVITGACLSTLKAAESTDAAVLPA